MNRATSSGHLSSAQASSVLSRLEEIFSADQIHTDPSVLAARQVDHLQPAAVVQPTEVNQVAELVRFAASEKLALIASGNGSKLAIGAPPERYDVALDLSRMNRVLAYDPDDLTLGVEPGIRVADLHTTLQNQKQFLPLSVPFGDRATIGGIAASNSNSPLRHSFGGVRDFCLGMEFVTGDGAISKSGGRVVKNVTGYDLHKLLIGSLGTLAVITRVNFRTFPIPPVRRSFVTSFLEPGAAFGFCRAIGKSVLTPQIAEVLSPAAAELLSTTGTPFRLGAAQWSVVMMAAGQTAVVERYSVELAKFAAAADAAGFITLDDSEMSSVIAGIAEFPRLVLDATPQAMIFRISLLPTAMPPLIARLTEVADRNGLGLATATRASGFLYAAFLPKETDAAPAQNLADAAQEVFKLCGDPQIGARAMIEWCPTEVKRAGNGIWESPRPELELMQRVKNVFDPQRVLSPGRFAGGI